MHQSKEFVVTELPSNLKTRSEMACKFDVSCLQRRNVSMNLFVVEREFVPMRNPMAQIV